MIESHNEIIIARHKNPDLDAYGSQFGLYYALKEYYPNKKIHVIGDTNNLNMFQDFEDVDAKTRKESLVFILDTVAKQMLDEDVYHIYSKLILIDHHRNDADIKYDCAYQDVNASSTSEIITEMLLEWNIPINYKTARALYLGIIGDTGRFMYNNTTEKTFLLVSKLMRQGLDIQQLHNEIYLEPKKNKEMKNLFFQNVNYTKKHVAYSKNKADFMRDNNLTTSFVSRGLVNQMAGMHEVPIWVNFTEEIETNEIYCEIRSREIPVLDVAKKYGGGGHLNACGCTLYSWEETDMVLEDLDKLIKEN